MNRFASGVYAFLAVIAFLAVTTGFHFLTEWLATPWGSIVLFAFVFGVLGWMWRGVYRTLRGEKS